MRKTCAQYGVVVIALVFVAAISCTPDSEADSGATVLDGALVVRMDSSGIEVVQTVEPAWSNGTTPWSVSEPVIRIGSVDDTLSYLSGVRGVAIGPRGEIAIGNYDLHEVRAFSPDGFPLWRQGVRGAGPGEYEYLLDLRGCGDQIMVRDSELRRLTMIDWSGQVVHQRAYSPLQLGTTTAALDCNAVGWFSQLDRGLPQEVSSIAYVSNAVVSTGDLIAGEGEVWLDTPGFDRYRFSGSDAPADLGMHTLMALQDSLIHIVVTNKAEVRSYDLDGRLIRISVWGASPRQVSGGLLTEIAASKTAVLPRSMREAAAAEWIALPHAETLPFVDKMIVSGDGEIWIREFDEFRDRTSASRWLVFSASGVWLGVVDLPSRFDLLEVTASALAGLHLDDLNVEYVEVRSIQR